MGTRRSTLFVLNLAANGTRPCARVTTGHAAALPTPAMNSRRSIRDLPR
jgi:hypothetical protein